MYRSRDIYVYVMYYVYVMFGPSLLTEYYRLRDNSTHTHTHTHTPQKNNYYSTLYYMHTCTSDFISISIMLYRRIPTSVLPCSHKLGPAYNHNNIILQAYIHVITPLQGTFTKFAVLSAYLECILHIGQLHKTNWTRQLIVIVVTTTHTWRRTYVILS